jgi:argininosuccinate synthase
MKIIVLAYSGGVASSSAIGWLTTTCAADVVTVTVDVGQGDDLAVLRARALACGAGRAHVIDARDELVRDYFDALAAGPPGTDSCAAISTLTPALVARKLFEVARIESTSVVAHASVDTAVDDVLHALDPSLDILAPAREWKMDAARLSAYARARGVPSGGHARPNCRVDQNLWGRTISFRDADDRPELEAIVPAPEPARVDILFESGVPIAVNDVPLSPVELVESLALIAGRQGIGRMEHRKNGYTVVFDAPAAMVLRAASAALAGRNGVAQLSLSNGRCTVREPDTAVVNLA